jgi:hypothetical protein
MDQFRVSTIEYEASLPHALCHGAPWPFSPKGGETVNRYEIMYIIAAAGSLTAN